ncbi:MAG: glycosyltransferase [Stenomitos rutilans HA7619-LM2]|jgi:glycosyltransferase involved in cell wall biosynthesis|nr:glycosyltransferase [Stenomitos rutilans HA7619-LM2]
MDTLKTIRLSIIVACFNDGQFIKEALASAEACPDPIYEILIVNDGSTDPSTCQILNELKNNGYRVIDQPNQGVAIARNNGIKLARGEYILPLDSDNLLRPAYISKGVEILDRFPDVAVVYGDVERFGEGIDASQKLLNFNLDYSSISFDNGFRGVQRVPDFNLAWLVRHNYIDACAVFRKSAWEECGGYDANTPFGCYSDWDLWLSIAKKGYRFYHVPEILFDYRIRAISLSTAARSEEKSKVVRRYFASKHMALLPKEYRYYFKPYQYLLERLTKFQSFLVTLIEFFIGKKNIA